MNKTLNREKKNAQPSMVRSAHAEAQAWRGRPLRESGELMFWISPWVELVYGKIAMADHRVDTVAGLLAYAAAFANREEVQPGLRFAPDDDARLLEYVQREIQPERLEQRRQELCTLLRAAVQGPSNPDEPDFVKQPQEFLDDILKRIGEPKDGRVTSMMSLDRGFGFRVYIKAHHPDAFIAVLAERLLNEKHRKLLAICKKCGRFFVVEQTMGRPRNIYCGDKCMDEADSVGSAARQRESYKRRRATQILIEQWTGRAPAQDKVRDAIKRAFKADPAATAGQLAKSATTLLHSGRRSQK